MSEDTILLSSRELAKVLGISQLTVRRLVYMKILPYYKLKSRYRFMVSEVLAALGRADEEANLYVKEKEDPERHTIRRIPDAPDTRHAVESKAVQHKRPYFDDDEGLSDSTSLEAGELPKHGTQRKHGSRKGRS